MSSWELGRQAGEKAIVDADRIAREKDPLAYDKAILQRMAEAFDDMVKIQRAKVEKLLAEKNRRIAREHKTGIGAAFHRVVEHLRDRDPEEDRRALRYAETFSSSDCNEVRGGLATAGDDALLAALKESWEYKNVVAAAQRNNVELSIGACFAPGACVYAIITRPFDGPPVGQRARMAPRGAGTVTPPTATA